MTSKDPGPEDPALISPQRGDEGRNFYKECSGVRCQVSGVSNRNRPAGWESFMIFFSPLLTFSLNPFRVQNSGFVFY
ncbi:hypothetical protein D1AOALGA4SA_11901 [Olavius algarvensis Delta 1 endosymbiont]|nr:hypothetical protein D1AOALGA4SA_11901 [Olavius algarvensis Delta 1 endosymbiont]